MRLCINAGLKIAGVNSEFAPSQWEFQIGIADGIECGDQVWMARYILERCAELFGLDINYEPKSYDNPYYSSGGHMNFSTVKTREEGGLEYMKTVLMRLLETSHEEVMPLYGGSDNKKRLNGKYASSYDRFSWGVGSRSGSVRIPI